MKTEVEVDADDANCTGGSPRQHFKGERALSDPTTKCVNLSNGHEEIGETDAAKSEEQTAEEMSQPRVLSRVSQGFRVCALGLVAEGGHRRRVDRLCCVSG